MEAFLETLYTSDAAAWMRASRWGYAAVSAAHILALALLAGAILSLDLRLAGLWRGVPLAPLDRVLAPVAAAGLSLAVASGVLLFITRAVEYADLPLFVVKLALIAAGTVHAAAVRLRGALPNRDAAALRRIGLTSAAIWLSVLVCGRMLAFVGG